MGLVTGLLTLPLAPVRGTAWIAGKLLEEAERELDVDGQLRRRLDELVVAHELGEVGDDEYEHAEAGLIERFDALRQPEPEGGTSDAGDK